MKNGSHSSAFYECVIAFPNPETAQGHPINSPFSMRRQAVSGNLPITAEKRTDHIGRAQELAGRSLRGLAEALGVPAEDSREARIIRAGETPCGLEEEHTAIIGGQ